MSSQSKIIIYKSDDGKISVDTLMKDESLWLSQKSMAQLFDCTPENIILHLKNIYETGEINEKTTAKDFLVVQKEGSREVNRNIKHYNLDAIISVGYRVNSIRGTQFRIWATQRLKEYLLQGFTLNEEKLKSGKTTEYFDKLQVKLREIRLSERVFYQKIKDIYATSIDYDQKNEKTIQFFQIVQNKLLWAISQKTAAELVYTRVDSSKPFLGMQSCDKKTEKEITKSDVSIAKNYLDEDEMKTLGLIVEQYLAFAESMAQSQTAMAMADWIERLDGILQMNRKGILTHYGKVSRSLALAKSEKEYNFFKIEQKRIEKLESLEELEKDLKNIA
ncbi:MAG: virulence RhuM family protein [Patescibacteria group bacterium]|nr:virulence RhuM family protein [Patescibacteria group bacterium]